MSLEARHRQMSKGLSPSMCAKEKDCISRLVLLVLQEFKETPTLTFRLRVSRIELKRSLLYSGLWQMILLTNEEQYIKERDKFISREIILPRNTGGCNILATAYVRDRCFIAIYKLAHQRGNNPIERSSRDLFYNWKGRIQVGHTSTRVSVRVSTSFVEHAVSRFYFSRDSIRVCFVSTGLNFNQRANSSDRPT